jgi:hypothetical protein
MNDAGFVLFDIVAVNRRPLDLALAQMDAVFVPKTSPLRQMGPPGTVNPKLASDFESEVDFRFENGEA